MSDPNDPGIPLADLKTKPGRWSHSQRFGDAHVAKSWGLTPSQFRTLSLEDQAEMAAHDRSWGKMEAYELEQAEKRAKRKEKTSRAAEGMSGAGFE